MTRLPIVSVLVANTVVAACGSGSSSSGDGKRDTAPFEGFYGGTYSVELRSLEPFGRRMEEEGSFALVIKANGTGTVAFGSYGTTDVRLLRQANEIRALFSEEPVFAAPNCAGTIILRITIVNDMATGDGDGGSNCDTGEYLASIEVVAQRSG